MTNIETCLLIGLAFGLLNTGSVRAGHHNAGGNTPGHGHHQMTDAQLTENSVVGGMRKSVEGAARFNRKGWWNTRVSVNGSKLC